MRNPIKKIKSSSFKKIQAIILVAALLVTVFSVDTSAASSSNSITKKISSGKTVTISESEIYKKTKDYVYLKYTATKNGYVRLKFSNATSSQSSVNGYVWITNKSKKSLSYTEYFCTNASTKVNYKYVYYGVTKGTTYYFKVKTNDAVKVTLKQYTVKDSSGSKQSKATTIKAGKTKKGYIAAEDSSSDYYKIVLTKAQKIKLTFKGYTNNKLQLSIYKITSGKKVSQSSAIYLRYTTTDHSVSAKTKKLSAGTYYIVVSAGTKSSGYYSLSWKKVS